MQSNMNIINGHFITLENNADDINSITIENGKIKTFSVSLGFEPNGKKTKKGDGKTPEGLYYIERKIQNTFGF